MTEIAVVVTHATVTVLLIFIVLNPVILMKHKKINKIATVACVTTTAISINNTPCIHTKTERQTDGQTSV